MSAGSILFWCAMALYFACQILVVEGIYRKKLPLQRKGLHEVFSGIKKKMAHGDWSSHLQFPSAPEVPETPHKPKGLQAYRQSSKQGSAKLALIQILRPTGSTP